MVAAQAEMVLVSPADWPTSVLEVVFSFLDLTSLFNASLVCKVSSYMHGHWLNLKSLLRALADKTIKWVQ